MKCAVDGCKEVFRTPENLASNARFVCRNHPRQDQLEVVGRVLDYSKDAKDFLIHFQDHQFEGCDSMAVPLLDEKNLLAGAPDPAKRHVTWTAKRGN